MTTEQTTSLGPDGKPERWVIVVPWSDHTADNPQPGAHVFGPWPCQEDAMAFMVAWVREGSAAAKLGYVSQVIDPTAAANAVRKEEQFKQDIKDGAQGL